MRKKSLSFNQLKNLGNENVTSNQLLQKNGFKSLFYEKELTSIKAEQSEIKLEIGEFEIEIK